MTQLLIRLFIRHPDNPQNPHTRAAYGNLASIVGMVCNVLLCLGKLAVGTLFGSIAIMADALNNLSDASSNIVSLVGFKLASRAPDAEHPFGHARYEYLAGLVVSVTVLGIGFSLLKESVVKVLHPTAVQFSLLTVAVLVASILVKLWMSSFNRTIGRTIGSETLIATAADSRNDVLSTGAVLIATILCRLTGWNILDGLMGVGVAVFILISGWGLVMDTLSPLLGERPSDDLVDHIEQTVMSYPGVLGVHDLMIHDYGPGRKIIVLHAEVPAEGNILQLHDVVDNVERGLEEKFNCLATIHMDPVVTTSPRLNAIKEECVKIVKEINPDFSLHDFRMNEGDTHANVIFDLVTPPENKTSARQIRKAVNEKLKLYDKKLNAIITVENSFV